MLHDGQGLPLGLEACKYLIRIQTRTHDLQRNTSADFGTLLRLVDKTHPALAEQLQNPVRTDGSGMPRE
jgi:hypothetical protein